MGTVVAVGGAVSRGGALEASNYASGFRSSLCASRIVPDVCGLRGEKPMGVHIPMPCAPSSCFDRAFASGGAFPNGDETRHDDGWVHAGGTSAATAQVAGVVALLHARADALGIARTPARVQAILRNSARPVTRGRNALGFPADDTRPDVACGYGLVDARAALAALVP